MTRIFTILFIISLYLFGFYQNHKTADQWNRMNRTVISKSRYAQDTNSKPYYSEDFVSKEKADMISHVSSIAEASDGSLLCVWYSGSREGGKDVAIMLSRSEKGGKWSAPVTLTDRMQTAADLDRYIKKVGNPLLLADNKGRLWLVYASVTFGGWSGTTLNYMVSHDNGNSWSTARKLILSPFFNLTNNVKNSGILLDDGSFLVPVYHEFINKYSQLLWMRSDKHGVRYRVLKMTGEENAIQPALLKAGNNSIIAYFRNIGTDKNKYILTATSHDLGRSWSELSETRLPNPNAGFDMIALENGTFLGVINNSFYDRSNLSLVISPDTGKNWTVLKVLENSPQKEYSYPSVIRSSDGSFHLTYTYERKRIKHVSFNESWLRKLMEAEH